MSKIAKKIALRFAQGNPERRRRIICVGGGTGVSMILSGLVDYPHELGAVVTMFDDGGSSGRLARKFHILPPGDIRQCLVATAKNKKLINDFTYRFKSGPQKGHSRGNILILEAVKERNGDWNKAIEKLSKKLNVKAKIYPVALKNAKITAILKNNKKIAGEENIINSKEISKVGIKKLYLDPKVKANPKAISAIKQADLIVIGPGKLYTSIMPNLLVNGIPQAIAKSKGKKVFISNLMTQEGNTDNFSVEDFVGVIEKNLGRGVIDYKIFNIGKLNPELSKRVKKIFPKADFIKYGENLTKKEDFIGKDLLDRHIRQLNPADILVKGQNQRTIVFHDSNKLAKIISKLLN